MNRFQGRPPGGGAGEISRRTEALRPGIGLTPKQSSEARTLRREGFSPEIIAEKLGSDIREVEKALCQMRMPRPETTRGTVNVTLAAHDALQKERVGDEPMWRTMDRILDELFRLRAAGATREPGRPTARRAGFEAPPLLALLEQDARERGHS